MFVHKHNLERLALEANNNHLQYLARQSRMYYFCVRLFSEETFFCNAI